MHQCAAYLPQNVQGGKGITATLGVVGQGGQGVRDGAVQPGQRALYADASLMGMEHCRLLNGLPDGLPDGLPRGALRWITVWSTWGFGAGCGLRGQAGLR